MVIPALYLAFGAYCGTKRKADFGGLEWGASLSRGSTIGALIGLSKTWPTLSPSSFLRWFARWCEGDYKRETALFWISTTLDQEWNRSKLLVGRAKSERESKARRPLVHNS